MAKKKSNKKSTVKKNPVKSTASSKKNNVKKSEVKGKNKVESKPIVKSSKLDPEISNLIKIVIGVGVVVAVVYLLTMLMTRMGVFDAGYTKPDLGATVISYEDALVGNMFNKTDGEYYVVLDEFGENANQYLASVLYRYKKLEDKLPMYKVDLSNGFNTKYLGEGSNPSAQVAADVKVSGPTLIKIKNGKNILFVEGIEYIEKELLK